MVVAFITFFVLLGIGLAVEDRRRRRRLLAVLEGEFKDVLTAQGVTDPQILQESMTFGNNRDPFQLHRIVFGPPGRWFVYIHVRGDAPVLNEISEQRANAVVKSRRF
jgi:hypothetical protein